MRDAPLLLTRTLLFLAATISAASCEEDRLKELDTLWSEVSRSVREGDFEGYAATCHEKGVLVSGSKGTSSPLSDALTRWKPGFLDTKAGKLKANVTFRFSARLGDATTAHETGMFLYTTETAEGESTAAYIHLEALLVKEDGWQVLMEYQKSTGTQAEWDALANTSRELRVPAETAYFEPDARRWNKAETSMIWYGQLKKPGKVQAKVEVQLPEGEAIDLELTINGETNKVRLEASTDGPATADFGAFEIGEAGYQAFTLRSPQPKGKVLALSLSGNAMEDAHFNLKPRRNSASVHLAYPVDRGTKVSAFYCEMTGIEDPLWTYYMACGWHRGYFGMQVNSPTERRIIFSVWDSGGEAIDRDKVGQEDRVTLVAKGEDVYSGDFGNEGTGGHSHLKYPWKTGERQQFLVTAEPVDETHTIFAGYYFHPDKKDWMLISSWKAPKEGKRLRGLYSFSENFAGRNGHVLRKALYENQWLRTAEGEWKEITKATFSHDKTGREDRLDRFMGLTDQGKFFLSHGGFVEGFTKFGEPFERPASGRSPAEMKLPPLP